MYIITEFRVVFSLFHEISTAGSFFCTMHTYGTWCLSIFSGLLNNIEMSLFNVYTADLHHDSHVIPLSRDMLM